MDFFNLSRIKNSGVENAKEGEDYVVIEDGNGDKLRVINLNNEKFAPKKGVVTLIPLKLGKGVDGPNGHAMRHQNEASFRVTTDKVTGFLIGIPDGIDPKSKEYKFRRIVVRGQESLDLSIPMDRAKYICVTQGPFFKGSPNFVNTSKTIYTVSDPEQEAKQFRLDRRNRKKAEEFAETLIGESLIDAGLALGFDPKLMSEELLWKNIMQMIERPDKDRNTGKYGWQLFLEYWDSEIKEETVILKRGLSTGILQQDVNKGINFDGLSLGFNDPEAIRYLKDHPATARSIDMRSRNKMNYTTPSVSTAPVVNDEKDAEILNLKKRLAEAEKLAADANAVALEEKSEAILKEEAPEYAAALQKAKELGIKGPHLIGKNDPPDIKLEKLLNRIAEHESQIKN